jgi:hypothetical protein
MRRLTIAPPETAVQADLLTVQRDKAFETAGAARGHCGHVVEEVVTAGLGLTPIPIDGRYDVCFDAIRAGVYFEIKSVRHGGKAPIYVWRVNKELRAGVQVLYCFAEHNGRGLASFADLYAKIVPTIQHVHVVTLAEVRMLSDAEPVHAMATICNRSRRNGYQRAGYRDGYKNVPTAEIRRLARIAAGRYSGTVDGSVFSFTLHASRRAWPVLAGTGVMA